MKPRIRERPIQAWGVRDGTSEEECVGAGFSTAFSSSVSRIEISPSAVGVLGGSSLPDSITASSGMTGPGIASKGPGSGVSSSSRLCSQLVLCIRFRLWWSRGFLGSRNDDCRLTSLRSCACFGSLALYRVSTPSGMITIRAVPTRTPIPMVEIRRSRDWDSEKDNGRDPARKDLVFGQSITRSDLQGLTQWPSKCSR